MQGGGSSILQGNSPVIHVFWLNCTQYWGLWSKNTGPLLYSRLEPHWNASFVVSLGLMRAGKVSVEVYDKDMAHDELLGWAELDVDVTSYTVRRS